MDLLRYTLWSAKQRTIIQAPCRSGCSHSVMRTWQEDGRDGQDHWYSTQREVTFMKAVISVVLALTLAASAGVAVAQSTPEGNSLQYKDCIRLDQINEWHVVDPKTAIVRTGPYQRYLVKLKASCDKLGIGNPGMQFIPSEADKAITPVRICGGVGEKVRSRDQPGCAIDSVSLIDEAAFDEYRAKAKHHSVRTQQPRKNP